MKTRRFGRTNLDMPIFSCGGMRYQQSWEDEDPAKIDPAGQANLEATIRRSVELGINHIETARGYGSSEMQLGNILPTFPREELIVQTKVGPSKRETYLETFNKSMRYLRLDYVDLLSIHGINNAELLADSLAPGGALEACRQIQREGRARFIGFSTHGPCEAITDAVNTGEFDYVNLHWYYVNQINWPAVEAATALDVGVFIISPNDKGGKLYEAPPKLTELCAPWSPMVFNDLFCLRRPEVHTLSLGASRPSDFDEHLRAAELLDRADEIVPEVAERIRAALVAFHGREWMEGYSTGLPAWEDVPGHVNIQEILRLWTLATGLDMIEFAKMRYNLLGNGGHWFPGLNAKDMDEGAIRNCLGDHPFRDRIPAVLREADALLREAPVERLSSAD